jgi:hypothetical protein
MGVPRRNVTYSLVCPEVDKLDSPDLHMRNLNCSPYREDVLKGDIAFT